MPATPAPRLYADARGVWVESRPGQGHGIEWGEIHAVHGYKLDGITDVYTVVELDFTFGESIELNHAWEGFTEVIQAITRNVSGIDPEWFAKVDSLEKHAPPLLVWRRA